MEPLVVALILCLGLSIPLWALRRVPDDRVVPVRRRGRFHRALGPGWHLVWPGIDRPGEGVPLIGHHVTATDASVGSAQAEVFFQILDPGLMGSDLERVDALVSQAAAQQLSRLGMPVDGPSLAAEYKVRLNRALEGLGLRVTRCQFR